jgi:hypothetical protein
MTNSTNRVEIITSVQRRRRWTAPEKVRMVEETFEPGMTVSLVARRHGVAQEIDFCVPSFASSSKVEPRQAPAGANGCCSNRKELIPVCLLLKCSVLADDALHRAGVNA